MNTKIQKFGNSLGVHIPKEIVKSLSLEKGSVIEITQEKKHIKIKIVQKKETLEDLLAKITPENRHELIEFGDPVGREIW